MRFDLNHCGVNPNGSMYHVSVGNERTCRCGKRKNLAHRTWRQKFRDMRNFRQLRRKINKRRKSSV